MLKVVQSFCNWSSGDNGRAVQVNLTVLTFPVCCILLPVGWSLGSALLNIAISMAWSLQISTVHGLQASQIWLEVVASLRFGQLLLLQLTVLLWPK